MKSTRRALAGSIALGLGLTACVFGCGVKSAPVPPEFARPERITDLHASADPSGIKLNWGRPTRYTGGHAMRDLGGFVILRGEGEQPMQTLVELPVNDQERFSVEHEFSYVDGETALGRRYRYEIVSKTTDGYTSEPSNDADFTRIRPLSPPNPETFKLPRPNPRPANSP
jgi:hypothetical protein